VKGVFFGLNTIARESYINTTMINENWVENHLSASNCTIESIVILSQATKQTVFDKMNEYLDECSIANEGVDIPVLSITGDVHPETYCLTRLGNRFDLTVEAFKSDSVKVSVVLDPSGSRGDYFQVNDTQIKDKNNVCPSLFD